MAAATMILRAPRTEALMTPLMRNILPQKSLAVLRTTSRRTLLPPSPLGWLQWIGTGSAIPRDGFTHDARFDGARARRGVVLSEEGNIDG
eukprot:3181602-Pleurochrysis_carterae.AAC.1